MPYKLLKTLMAQPERTWKNSNSFPKEVCKTPIDGNSKTQIPAKLVFNPENQKLVDFLDELQNLAKDAFGIAPHAIIEQFIYAKMPPHLKKSMNQAHLENGAYEQIVTHLERELELNGLEATDELPINNVSQQPTNTNADRPKPKRATTAKKQDITEISVVC